MIDFDQYPHFPKVIVFDLDYTLWPLYCDCLSGPPFRLHDERTIVDKRSNEVKLFDEVPNILSVLKSYADTNPERYRATAIASRTPAIDWALQILSLLPIVDPTGSGSSQAMKHFLNGPLEIYPTEKTKHFKAITSALGVSYQECLFFDDEFRNIRGK
jgi:magnesium-dependent phosphatase 1